MYYFFSPFFCCGFISLSVLPKGVFVYVMAIIFILSKLQVDMAQTLIANYNFLTCVKDSGGLLIFLL